MKWGVLLFMMVGNPAAAQYFLAENYPIPPAMVIVDQYEMMPGEYLPGTTMWWNPGNDFTRLYVLRNNEQRLLHILVQTDLSGEPTYIGFSKNINISGLHHLSVIYKFRHCLQEEIMPRFSDDKLIVWLKCIVHLMNDFK